MVEGKKSRLFALKPLIERWPAVSRPEGHVPFRTKIIWTVLCLIIYFILTNIMLFGLKGEVIDLFAGYRFIMAGASGSIMHLGIGPIVTASIILQLFVGAKIIKLDLTKKEDKAIYQGTQKILVIVMIIVVTLLAGYIALQILQQPFITYLSDPRLVFVGLLAFLIVFALWLATSRGE